MSELALRLITEAKEKRSTFIDLGNCGLTEIPEELYELTWLENLNLGTRFYVKGNYDSTTNTGSKNQLKKIPEKLYTLENLKVLTLVGNQIFKIEGLESLEDLFYLNLSDNQLTKIEGLSGLNNLSRLFLSNNQLVKIEGLSELSNLSDLNSNEITKIEGLSELNNLSDLNLDYNQLSKIEGLSGLSNLSRLSLYSNQLSKIEGLSGLSNLSRLSLYSNQIVEEGITKEFIETFKYSNLWLDLDDNPIQQIILEWNQNHFPAIISYFTQKQEVNLVEVQLPKKILLLGNHAAGKSSLLSYLQSGKINAQQDSTHILRIADYEKTTADLPKAIFFDFGGQDFYHGLYRIFLSNQAVHLMLWHPKSNCNEVKEDNNERITHHFALNYWQGQKKFIESKNGATTDPSLIVRTHIDNEPTELDNIKSDFQLSLLSDAKLKNLSESKRNTYQLGRQYFKATLDGLIEEHSRKDELAPWYIAFMQYLYAYETQNPEEPVKISQIKKQYKREKVDADKLDTYFREDLRQFHLSGILLYYPYIPAIAEVAWLDPQGLVQYVHKHILTKKIVSDGIVSEASIEKIDNQLKTLLITQKVIFFDPADEQYIIPNYLPLVDKRDPDHQLLTFGMEDPDFVIQFNDFIPFGLINQLICFFGDNPDKKRFWRDQLIFTLSQRARVLIKLDFQHLQISVFHQLLKTEKSLTSATLNRYLFLTIMAMYWDRKCVTLEKYLEQVSPSYGKEKIPVVKETTAEGFEVTIVEKTLEYELFNILTKRQLNMSLSTDGQYFVDYHVLVDSSERIVKAYSIDYSEESASKTFKNINKSQFNPFMKNAVKEPLKIFISYSKRDTTYKEQLLVHLSKMQREGLIEIWHDQMIEVGEWDAQIKTALDHSDVVICLVSQNFFDSQYIWDHELNGSLKRAEKGECKIIPVLIRDCDWESWTNFGDDEKAIEKPESNMKINQLQFYPYYDYERNGEVSPRLRAIATWPQGEEPFMQVVKALRREMSD